MNTSTSSQGKTLEDFRNELEGKGLNPSIQGNSLVCKEKKGDKEITLRLTQNKGQINGHVTGGKGNLSPGTAISEFRKKIR